IVNKEALLEAVRKEGLKPVSARQAEHGHEGHGHSHDEEDGHAHSGAGESPAWKAWLPAITSFVMLMAGILADNFIQPSFFTGWVRLIWYGIAYLPVGWPVASKGIRLLLKGDIFTEFVLMTIATLGAFYIGEYPEGVAV